MSKKIQYLKPLSIALGLSLTASITANAQTATIYRSGVMTTPTYTTLSSAISASLDGDSIVLSPHTFKEYNVTIAKTLAITGSRDTSGFQTTIDADKKGRALLINSGKVDLLNLTVKNGKIANDYGAGICCFSTDPLTLNGTTIIEGNRVEGDIALGGGIYAAGRLNVYDSTIIRNNYSSHEGGGVYAYSAFVINDWAQLINNKADGSGGGVFAQANGACLVAGNALVANNESVDAGGGIFGVGTLQNRARILNNKSKNGGGIASFSDVLIVKDSVQISGNTAIESGAGLWLNNCTMYGSGLFSFKNNTIALDTNIKTQFGGAIYNVNGSIYLSGGVFRNNISPVATIYNTATGNTTVKVNNAILYNPQAKGVRNYEVYNSPSLPTSIISFDGNNCWWGSNDTTNLIGHKAGTPRGTIDFYATCAWVLNNGLAISPDSSHFPLTAKFTMQDGSKIDSTTLRDIVAYYVTSNGTFTKSNSIIDTLNNIDNVYNAPLASDTIHIVAYVDADTFKAFNIAVKGLSISTKQLQQESVKVYPNPATDFITIADLPANANIQIYSIDGKLKYSAVSTNNQEIINISNFATGNYILSIRVNNIVRSCQISKQ